jgi:hypothetical protein
MDQNQTPSEDDSITGGALFACLVSMILIRAVAERLTVLPVSWMVLLIGTLISIAVPFGVLYCSFWHREMSRVARMSLLLWQACIIFGAALIFSGIVAVSFYVFFNDFCSFHY